jgi:hypothetical protein
MMFHVQIKKMNRQLFLFIFPQNKWIPLVNFNENFLLFSRLPFARLNFEKEKKNFPRSRMETRCDRKFPTTTTKQHFNLNKFIFFLFEINRERNTCALQSLYIFLLLLAFLLHSHSIFWFDRAQPRSHLLRRNKTPHLPKTYYTARSFVRSFSFTFFFSHYPAGINF